MSIRRPSNAPGNVVAIRAATAADAQQIGAVFDAAIAEGWKYLGDLARLPMFPPEEWDKVVAEAAVWVVPCSLQTCEMYLSFVHPKHAARAAECVTCSRE